MQLVQVQTSPYEALYSFVDAYFTILAVANAHSTATSS